MHILELRIKTSYDPKILHTNTHTHTSYYCISQSSPGK